MEEEVGVRCRGRRITRGAMWGAMAAALILTSFAGAPASRASGNAPTGAPNTLKLPADLVYEREVGADSAVVFSHETHVAFEGNRCTGCHPRPFRMLSPSHRTGHGDMNAGGSCGTCHNGKQAFGVEDADACATCHSGRKAEAVAAAGPSTGAGTAPKGPKVPGPHVYPAADASPGRVTFRHANHLAAGCAACHPKLFSMKPAPPRPEGGMHEASACGACHDGKKAFGAEDPDRCERCHAGGGS